MACAESAPSGHRWAVPPRARGMQSHAPEGAAAIKPLVERVHVRAAVGAPQNGIRLCAVDDRHRIAKVLQRLNDDAEGDVPRLLERH